MTDQRFLRMVWLSFGGVIALMAAYVVLYFWAFQLFVALLIAGVVVGIWLAARKYLHLRAHWQAERRRAAQEEAERQRRIAEDARNQEIAYLKQFAAPHKMLGLPPKEFERFVLRVFAALGYETEEVRHVADGGIDGVLRRGGQRWIIQCKRYAGTNIGEPPVRDLLGVVTKERAAGGLFVTTSGFSPTAVNFAEGTTITLVDGVTLAKWIEGLSFVDPDAAGPVTVAQGTSPQLPAGTEAAPARANEPA